MSYLSHEHANGIEIHYEAHDHQIVDLAPYDEIIKQKPIETDAEHWDESDTGRKHDDGIWI